MSAPMIDAPATSSGRGSGRGLATWLAVFAPFVLAVTGWWLYEWLVDPPTATLAGPQEVWAVMTDSLLHGDLLKHYTASLRRLAYGIPLGVGSGYLLGLAIGRSRPIADFFEPMIALLAGISGLAWVPLAILWFGIGDMMVAFIIWNTTFFVVLFNTVAGVRAVPVEEELAIRTLGGTRMDVLRSVVVPAAMPQVMIGLRTGVGFAWRSLIAAEIIGASFGLGHMIYSGMAFFRSDIIIGGCLLLGFSALATDRLVFAPLERRTVARWGTVSAGA